VRVSGVIGYGEQRKIRPGVVDDVIIEKRFRGDVVRPPSSGPDEGQKVNDDLRVNVTISIVAGAYHSTHVHALRYISWQGQLWKVSNVEVAHPRIILRLGGLYRGPKASAPGTPGGDSGE
jgi:hypothetical protein